MEKLTKLQEAKLSYEEHGVDCHEDYIRELEKVSAMWDEFKELVRNKFTTSGCLDMLVKDIEDNHV
jgi:hypothetical protein